MSVPTAEAFESAMPVPTPIVVLLADTNIPRAQLRPLLLHTDIHRPSARRDKTPRPEPYPKRGSKSRASSPRIETSSHRATPPITRPRGVQSSSESCLAWSQNRFDEVKAALALVAADKLDDLKSLTHQPKEAYDLYKAEMHRQFPFLGDYEGIGRSQQALNNSALWHTTPPERGTITAGRDRALEAAISSDSDYHRRR
ncbi:hypothetical protein K438DRAFT_1993240 [Mycena galopus ATCC 62051]|nr:hypothetical protein K438DRAFT_1993240 [Mycena galopus ATCC 62051]